MSPNVLAAVGLEHLAAIDRAEGLVAMGHSPPHVANRVELHGSVEVGGQLRRNGDVVVVAVRAHHRNHRPAVGGRAIALLVTKSARFWIFSDV
jgi:hypothetical protein